jgi:hypothetical protein
MMEGFRYWSVLSTGMCDQDMCDQGGLRMCGKFWVGVGSACTYTHEVHSNGMASVVQVSPMSNEASLITVNVVSILWFEERCRW